jgi:Myosin tail
MLSFEALAVANIAITLFNVAFKLTFGCDEHNFLSSASKWRDNEPMHGVLQQLSREKKTLEENVVELKAQLGDEEERAKTLGKLKNKYEAIIAELEEKLRKEQEASENCVLHFVKSGSKPCCFLFCLGVVPSVVSFG